MLVILVWLAIVTLAWRVERWTSTRRHVRLVKEVFSEELRRSKAISLSTPGGAAGLQRATKFKEN